MAYKIITVLGATGTQGASVVDVFSDLPGWTVRAVTRNPSSDSAQALKTRQPNVEIVKADTKDVDSLKRAFSGSTAIFAVTDYWAPFKDPATREKHATGSNPGDSLRRWAFDEEVRLGANIAEAAAYILATESTLERFVFSSLPSCKKYSKGKYAHIYHFDSKSLVEDQIREQHPELAAKMSVVLIGFYVSNILLSEMMRPIKRKDGSFLVQRLCEQNAKHPFVLTREDTGLFVKALVTSPPGKIMLGYTAMLSWGEVAHFWGRALNRKVEFRQVDLDEFKKRFPVDGEELLSATYSAEFGFAGRDPKVLVPKDFGIEETPDRVREWLAEQDWSAVLNAEPATSS